MVGIDDMKPLIKELLMGFCLGAANIIPGVSGGTFLLIFKIYERVFAILNNINKDNIIYILSLIIKIVFKSDRSSSINTFVKFLKKSDFIFLFKLIAGAIVAILSLSSLMKYLIVYQFSATYSLFFGLILISIIIPVKMLENKKVYLVFFAALGVIATIYVSYAVNPYDKVKDKSEHYKTQYLQSDHNITKEREVNRVFAFTNKYTLDEYIYALICGAIAISAMVLPGISGSLVLILMGEYFAVISAISGLGTLHLDYMAFLGCFTIGIVFGGLIFAKLVNYVLKQFYDPAMAFLAGLMTGSLYALWPFKKSIIMAQQYIKQDGVVNIVENVKVYTNINELPIFGTQLYIAGIFFITGCIVMFFFIGNEIKD
jgi:putative membrane protein